MYLCILTVDEVASQAGQHVVQDVLALVLHVVRERALETAHFNIYSENTLSVARLNVTYRINVA